MVKFDSVAKYYNLFIKFIIDSEKIYLKIKELSDVNKNSFVLDIGGGTGLIAEYFVHKVKKIIVLDPSIKMMDKIKSKEIEKIKGVAQKIPFKNETFDLVYCVDAFHHFTNEFQKSEHEKVIDKSIKEMLRVLKKKGSLILIEFDPDSLKGKLIIFFENKIRNFQSSFFTPVQLKKLFKKYDVTLKTYTLNKGSYLMQVRKI